MSRARLVRLIAMSTLMLPGLFSECVHEHEVNGRRVTCLPVVMSYTWIEQSSI